MPRQPIVYNFPVPRGAGSVGVGFKAERVTAPPARGTCFANMNAASDLSMMCGMAPASHQRADINRAINSRIGGRAIEDVPRSHQFTVKAEKLSFSRGATVKDVKTGRKGIIIHARAGYTAKTHSPVHRVSDRNGDSWLAKEKDLKLLY